MITSDDLSTLTNDELIDLQQMLNTECNKPWRTVRSLSLDNVLPYKSKEENVDNLETSPSLIKDTHVHHK